MGGVYGPLTVGAMFDINSISVTVALAVSGDIIGQSRQAVP